MRLADEELAGRVQGVPGAVVLVVADPDGEVVADPAPGEEARQGVGRRVLAEELPDRHGRDALVARGVLVEGAEERDAAVGEVFPAVLAVEDDGHESRGVVPAGVADGVQLAEEVGGGDLAGAALVVEADLVGEGVVAEDDGQLGARLGDLPGAIQQFGVADVAPAVAADLAVGRTAEDLLIRGDPPDAVPGQQRDHRLRDRPLARPHPARGRAEVLAVRRDGARDVVFGILGVAVAIRGQVDVGHRLACQPLVEQEGDDRVIEGGGRQLDLPALGELAMEGDDLAEQVALLVEEPVLLGLGVAAGLGLELGELGVLLEEDRVHPREIRPDLEVAQVAFAEAAEGLLGGVDAQARALEEFEIARVGADHGVGVGHEEVVEQVERVLAPQAVGRHARDEQVLVGRAVDVGVDLDEQAGDEVDRAAELGHLVQVHRHAEVVLGAVEAHPGHRVLPGHVVGVIRLMLVPHQRQGDLRHGIVTRPLRAASPSSRVSIVAPPCAASRRGERAVGVRERGPDVAGPRRDQA